MANQALLIKSAVDKCLARHDNTMTIRPKQLDAITAIVKGKDTLCLLPTPAGKSLIYQLLPSVFHELDDERNFSTMPIVIVVSPLVALMINQVEEANLKKGLLLNAVRLESSVSFREISSGKFNLIFGTPESWLLNTQWRDLLSTKVFVDNVVCIVVDE